MQDGPARRIARTIAYDSNAAISSCQHQDRSSILDLFLREDETEEEEDEDEDEDEEQDGDADDEEEEDGYSE